MLRQFLVVAKVSKVVNGESFDNLYKVYAKSGLHAVVAFLRDTGGVNGGICAYCVEGVDDIKTVRLLSNSALILGLSNGDIVVSGPECEVIQEYLPF